MPSAARSASVLGMYALALALVLCVVCGLVGFVIGIHLALRRVCALEETVDRLLFRVGERGLGRGRRDGFGNEPKDAIELPLDAPKSCADKPDVLRADPQ